jgi:cytosine/uracil/thiamine/allantoin permease
MKRSSRILIVGVILELFIAAIGAWLVMQMQSGQLTLTTSAADAAATIFSALGTVMGTLGGLLIVAYFVAKKKES